MIKLQTRLKIQNVSQLTIPVTTGQRLGRDVEESPGVWASHRARQTLELISIESSSPDRGILLSNLLSKEVILPFLQCADTSQTNEPFQHKMPKHFGESLDLQCFANFRALTFEFPSD